MAPKVNEQYKVLKVNSILDCALKLAIKKPVYKISMRDIISECNISQGGIYKYFSNIDDILIQLINRECENLGSIKEVENILAKSIAPEQIIYEYLQLNKEKFLSDIIGVGKIYYEITTMYVNDIEKLDYFLKNCNLSSYSAKYAEKGFEYINTKVSDGYFKPVVRLEDIYNFIITSLDGITRDLILSSCYESSEFFGTQNFDKNKLIHSFSVSLILLLGGNYKLIESEEFINE